MFQCEPRSLCKKDCGNILNDKHIALVQRDPNFEWECTFSQNELYVISPEALIKDIFNYIG